MAGRVWAAIRAAVIPAAVLVLTCLLPPGAGAGEAPGFTPLVAASARTEPFSLDAERSPSGTLLLRWRVEPGNYLYRDSLQATLDGAAVPLERPEGEAKDDPNFGVVQIFP
ncbi:protein-disulfide reductase DsbD domain-containing protein [Ancylobacter dichloromethanicus]